MRRPLAKDVLRALAEFNGVCVRPLAIRRTDTDTGLTDVIEVPCGARRSVKCLPCAERNRRLRIQQIREGWHLAEEPAIRPDRPSEDEMALVRLRAHLEFERAEAERASEWDQIPDIDAGIDEVDEALSHQGLRGHLTPMPGR
jgi:Replication initiator protein, pSAM2